MKKGYRIIELKVKDIKKLIYGISKISSYNPKYKEEKKQLLLKLLKSLSTQSKSKKDLVS